MFNVWGLVFLGSAGGRLSLTESAEAVARRIGGGRTAVGTDPGRDGEGGAAGVQQRGREEKDVIIKLI
jgi:hypothetical protein